jgi:hypothetical protein
MGPQDPNAPWSWAPPEWNESPSPFPPPIEPLPPAPAAPAPVASAPSDAAVLELPATVDEPFEQTKRVERPPGEIDAKAQAKIDKWLDFKRKEYEQFGASPEKMDRWLDFKRREYEKFFTTKPNYIAQATGPVGTINQIGQGGPFAASAEIPYGALDLPPDEAAQIEVDAPPSDAPPFMIGRPRPYMEMPDDFVGEPDAISGADLQAEIGPQDPYGPDPQDPYPDVEAAPDQRTPQMPDDYLDDEERAGKYAAMAPEEYEALRIKQQLARENFVATRQLEEIRKNRDEAEQNFRMENDARQRAAAATADVNARAKKLAETDITDDAWMESRSPMQKVAAFAAAILGGLASGSTGGRNMGLEHIQNLISSHTANLRANLANKRQALSEERGSIETQYGHDMDAARSAEVHRQAMYEAAIRGLEVEAQNFDPRGTTAVRIADGIRGLRAQAAQAQQAFEKEQFKNSLELSKFALEQDKHLLEVAKAQPDILLKMKKLQGGGAAAMRQPDYFAALGLPKPPFAMTDKDYDKWLSRQKSAKDLNPNDAKSRKEEADAKEAEAKAAASEKGYFVFNPETRTPLTDKDGKPVYIMDATARTDLDKKVAAAKGLRRLADLITIAKERHGGNIKALGSDEAQEMQTLVSMIDFETFKLFDLGAPSEGDKALAEGVRGGVDPSSFVKKSAAGFQKYAEQAEAKLNTALGAKGIEPIHFARRSDNEKAKPTLVDGFAKKIFETEYDPTDYEKEPWKKPPFDAVPREIREQRNRKVDEAFVALESYAHQPGNEGDLARKQLKEIAEKAPTAATRAKAKQILETMPGAHVRTDEAR